MPQDKNFKKDKRPANGPKKKLRTDKLITDENIKHTKT